MGRVKESRVKEALKYMEQQYGLTLRMEEGQMMCNNGLHMSVAMSGWAWIVGIKDDVDNRKDRYHVA